MDCCGLEVEAEAYLQSYFAAILKLIQAEVAVYGRFDGHMLVQEETVSDLWYQTQPVLPFRDDSIRSK